MKTLDINSEGNRSCCTANNSLLIYDVDLTARNLWKTNWRTFILHLQYFTMALWQTVR